MQGAQPGPLGERLADLAADGLAGPRDALGGRLLEPGPPHHNVHEAVEAGGSVLCKHARLQVRILAVGTTW